MFSKSKINEPGPKADDKSGEASHDKSTPAAPSPGAKTGAAAGSGSDYKSTAPKAKPPASGLSSDLHVQGNLKTTGDIQIEGTIEGDIRAHLLTVGEGATVKGEVIADDVVVNGRIVGRVRGLKVRLTSTARVEGDIIHKTIAIESGAHFEGSVQRQDDPLNSGSGKQAAAPASATAAPAPAQAAEPAKPAKES